MGVPVVLDERAVEVNDDTKRVLAILDKCLAKAGLDLQENKADLAPNTRLEAIEGRAFRRLIENIFKCTLGGKQRKYEEARVILDFPAYKVWNEYLIYMYGLLDLVNI